MVRWTPKALQGLKSALLYTEKNYPPTWIENLKTAVAKKEDDINSGNAPLKIKGRKEGTFVIYLDPLPFFIPWIEDGGDIIFLAFLHKKRKYP